MRRAWLTLLVCGCSAAPAPELAVPATPEAPGAAVSLATSRPCGALPLEVGRVKSDELDEISGLAESRYAPGIFYAHNDSGDDARLFAIERSGRVLAELELRSVPRFVDAEDIAVGPGPGGGSFIYVADTGNNFALLGVGIPRRKAVIYRTPEPRVSRSGGQRLTVNETLSIVLTFPHGARDVEAMLVDPLDASLLLLSKERDGRSQLLAASAHVLAAGGGELELVGELRFGQEPLPGDPMPTAASISRDGLSILVRTYSSVFLFRREPGESMLAALKRAPKRLPSPREPQGEAISFSDGDTAFITVSEGEHPALWCTTLAP